MLEMQRQFREEENALLAQHRGPERFQAILSGDRKLMRYLRQREEEDLARLHYEQTLYLQAHLPAELKNIRYRNNPPIMGMARRNERGNDNFKVQKPYNAETREQITHVTDLFRQQYMRHPLNFTIEGKQALKYYVNNKNCSFLMNTFLRYGYDLNNAILVNPDLKTLLTNLCYKLNFRNFSEANEWLITYTENLKQAIAGNLVPRGIKLYRSAGLQDLRNILPLTTTKEISSLLSHCTTPVAKQKLVRLLNLSWSEQDRNHNTRIISFISTTINQDYYFGSNLPLREVITVKNGVTGLFVPMTDLDNKKHYWQQEVILNTDLVYNKPYCCLDEDNTVLLFYDIGE